MTLQADITNMGYPNTTDIDNALTEAFDQLSNLYGSTLVEGTDTAWNRIAKGLAVHLLDRKKLVIKSFRDGSVIVPPLIPKEIMTMVQELISANTIGTTPETKFHSEYNPPDVDNDEKWSEPLN